MADYYDEREDPLDDSLPRLYGIPLPITAPRGGIKYPASAEAQRRIARNNSLKEALVAKTLNQQMSALKQEQRDLACRIATLDQRIKANRTPPPVEQTMWTIDVRFTRDGQLYNYLILRHNGMFYTTGTGADAKFFSWTQLLEWLDGMAGHSAMIALRTDHSERSPLEGRQA